jgi:DNA polymerase
MEDRAKAGFIEEIAAAFDWWRDAGVDCDFHDEPSRWLATVAARPLPREGEDLSGQRGSLDDRGPPLRGEAEIAAAAPPSTVVTAAWPQDLAAFTARWLSDPALDDGRTTGRVPPRGQTGAEFMVIVPDPERDDSDHLLSGPQGKLLEAMLAAMGIAPDRAYVASVLPRHMPMADWPALAAKGFGALLCQHIELVAPRRLIALGSNILPLLGNDPAHNPAVLRSFNQDGVTVPLLAGKSLAALIERPRWKAGLWQGWLDWTPG